MTNYLNQIESDLYKLNSITNGSGEVVEMVAELKEKYEKAKAFDAIKKEVAEELKRLTVIQADFPLAFESKIETLNNVMASMTQYESGEYDAKQ